MWTWLRVSRRCRTVAGGLLALSVIGVAAAANGNIPLLIIGLAIAIPIVIFGSTLMIKVMERFPVIVTVGAGLIGWVAGEAIVSDKILRDWFPANSVLFYLAAAMGALFVIALGKFLQRRSSAATA